MQIGINLLILHLMKDKYYLLMTFWDIKRFKWKKWRRERSIGMILRRLRTKDTKIPDAAQCRVRRHDLSFQTQFQCIMPDAGNF